MADGPQPSDRLCDPNTKNTVTHIFSLYMAKAKVDVVLPIESKLLDDPIWYLTHNNDN